MRPLTRLSLVPVVVFWLGCDTAIEIHEPPAVVTTATCPVSIELGGSLDPSGLQVHLNGVPMPLSEGPAGSFSGDFGPGDPLRDDNTLVVTAPDAKGTTKTRILHFQYLPPKASARVISDPADLIEGPLAHGALGDFLLENDVARFVVQGVRPRDLHSVGQYGGTLIDLELRDRPGRDSFFEITPSVNVETVIHATSVEVVNDGENGLPAVVRACGPDDLIDYINASSQVAQFGTNLPPGIDDQDYDVIGCTEYVLEADANTLRLDTTIENPTGEDIALFVGDYINGMGTLEQWTRLDDASFAVFDMGLGEALALPGLSILSYFGFRGAEGVSYWRSGEPLPGATFADSSFTTSGVSFVLASNSVPGVIFFGQTPLFNVPAGGSNSYSRIMGVGTGSGGDALASALALRNPGLVPGTLRGCVAQDPSAPQPAPGARVAVGPELDGSIRTLSSTFVTDENGCYEGALPPGSYVAAAARIGSPFEGGGATPLLHPVQIDAGEISIQDFLLPATARVEVQVSDENGAPLPARVAAVGFDPSPDPGIVFDFLGLLQEDGGVFDDPKESVPFGLTAFAYAGADGSAGFDLEPGTYFICVSRGTEYSLFDQAVTVHAGQTTQIDASIARVLDTSGYISSDYHVHLLNSPDSRVAKIDRVMQFAGEGIDNLIATEHDARTDLTPTIASLGLTSFLHSTVGEEITTFDYGHYNAYPLGVDPARPSGGSTDWAGEAPPGEDFPSNGHFVLSPAEIHDAVLDQTATAGGALNTSPNVVVQVNHIGGHFGPLKIDTSLEPPRSLLDPGEPAFFRLDPSVANFFHAFPALELWNGASRGAQSEFLVQRIGVWMNLLNQGIATTFIADTDTHDFLALRSAGARTWTPSSSDAPAAIDDDEVGGAVLGGKAVGGQGIFLLASLREADSPANRADFSLGGTTTLSTAGDGNVELQIDVQAPLWASFDTVEIYANAQSVVAGTNDGVPVAFGAIPTLTLVKDVDFALPAPLDVHPGVMNGGRQELHLTLPFSLSEDTWFVVVVKGSDGVSPPMFPVFPGSLSSASNANLADLLDGNLGEGGVLALGATNALYADVDGAAGFDPPGVRLAP